MARIAMFSAKPYDQLAFDAANTDGRHELVYVENRLEPSTVGFS